MAFYWIYKPDTGRLFQKLEGVDEVAAAATAEVFGGAYRECDFESPSTGIQITVNGWEWLPAALPAQSPEVANMRAERSSMLTQTAWTQTPDAPITEACKEAFRAWRVCLHRWLVDYPDGLTPLPDPPEIEYLPLEHQV